MIVAISMRRCMSRIGANASAVGMDDEMAQSTTAILFTEFITSTPN